MIVLDSSALIAVLRLDPEAERFVRIAAESGGTLLSAVNLHETSMVLAGRSGGPTDWAPLDRFLERLGTEIVPHDRELARVARDAFARFGKGRHPAGLNMGDCAAYALATSRGLPLLFKGEDFAKTDVVVAG